MTVLHLNEWIENKGGVEVYIHQLQELLLEKGHRSYWIGINEYEETIKITDLNGTVLYNGKNTREAFLIIEGIIKQYEVDIINIHSIFNKELIDFCLDRLPVVRFVHGPVMVCPGKDKFWRYSEMPCTIKYGLHCFWHIYSQGCANRHPSRVLKAWNFVNSEVHHSSKRYKRMIVMSDYIKEGLLECRIPEGKIVCNPYFTFVTPNEPVISEGRVKRLLFIGRLVASKGPHTLIESLRLLLKQRDDIHLDLVGDGMMRTELEKMVSESGIQDKVTFYGWLDRKKTDLLLKKSYIVFFPSIYPEAFGIVGIEAMMRGKPVIGFDVGGVKTWLEDGKTGFLIARKALDQMREKAELLLNNQELYNEMSINSRHNAVRLYSPEVHLERLLNVYNKVLNESRTAD